MHRITSYNVCYTKLLRTDVGKTYVTAGLAVVLRKMGIDIGIMKPFAAGTPQIKGYKSEDVEILSRSAQVSDPENLVNPQFFKMAASPYTASKKLKIKIRLSPTLSAFKKLSRLHQMILVEGMGGIVITSYSIHYTKLYDSTTPSPFERGITLMRLTS